MKDKGEFEYVTELGANNELENYRGSWIAVADNKIIAKEQSFKVAFTKAREKFPDKVPFVMKVPTESVMLL